MAKTNTNKADKISSVVLRCQFFGKKNPQRSWYSNNNFSDHSHVQANATFGDSKFVGYLDYASRKTEALMNKEVDNYLVYMNQDHKVTSEGLFTKNRDFDTNEEFKEWMKTNHSMDIPDKSLVWSLIVSFEQDFFQEHHIISKEAAAHLMRSTMDQFFKDNRIDPKSMQWVGQFHVDKAHHFHVHLRIHQTQKGSYGNDGSLKWTDKGKWKPSSLQKLKLNIIDECVKNSMERKKMFRSLGHRDDVKYTVLETLKNSKKMSRIVILAHQLQQTLKRSGRVAYNSLDIVEKLRADALVKELIHAGATSEDSYKLLKASVDDPIDKYLEEQQARPKYSNAEGEAIERFRQAKHDENFAHIANQVIKVVINGNWKTIDGSLVENKRSREFVDKRQRLFKKFNTRVYWSKAIRNSENEVKRAMMGISAELRKNIAEIEERNSKGVIGL